MQNVHYFHLCTLRVTSQSQAATSISNVSLVLMSHAPPNWTFSMFSFIGFILCCIPFPWQLAAWNTGTCLFMAWTGLACLNSFVNSIVWNGNVINWAPVWCDISARIYIGINVAIPATSLCIARRLYRITAIRNVMITRAERRQTVMIDFAIGVGLPVLGVILQYIPEGHRFDIFEDVGCFPAIYNTPVALILVSGPPILIGCVSAFYGVMSIWAFNNSRKQFNELLSGSRLTNYRYLRLICLSAVVSFVTLILGTFALIVNCIRGIEPWKGWADTHLDFSHINFYPAIFWRSIPIEETSIELSRWLSVMCAFIFFAFFGFAEEARKNYCNAIQFLVKRIPNTSVSSFRLSFFESSKSKPGIVSTDIGGTLPVFIIQNHNTKIDDFDSRSDMSISIRVGGALSDEKKRPFSLDLSSDAMSLSDADGTLADHKTEPSSPTSASGAYSTSTLSPSVLLPPGLPHTPRPDPTRISSARHLDADKRPVRVVQPMLNVASAPRHTTDTPSEVNRNTF